MIKPTCILDACSFIYLNRVRFSIDDGANEYSLLNLLEQNFSIRLSKEVSDEIKRNLPGETTNLSVQNRHKKIHSFPRKSLSHYQKILFGEVLGEGSNNKGEKDNLALTVDLMVRNKLHLIFLSDDKKATTNHLKKWFDSFPNVHVWDSLTFVLHLYFLLRKKPFFTKSMAEEAIKDLISYNANNRRAQLMELRDNGTIEYLKANDKITENSLMYNELKLHFLGCLNNINLIINPL